MKLLYDIGFLLFAVLYIPFSIYKKGFRSFNIKQRLGFIPQEVRKRLVGTTNIWIHAVSVGEVMAVLPMVKALNRGYPDYKVVITTTTNTGRTVAEKQAGRNNIIIFSPLDISFAIDSFLEFIKPQLVLLAETEIWPNLITTLHRKRIPTVLINGRVSPSSFKRYGLIRFMLRPILENIDYLCMQAETDARRTIALGAIPERVKVTGNMKFDITDYADAVARSEATKQSKKDYRQKLGLGPQGKLIVAGSTHPGEEEVLLGVYKDLLRDFPNLKLLIAPRHIERIPKLEKLIRSEDFKSVRISSLAHSARVLQAHSEPYVFLLDTIGELKGYYSIADIVFVGGSLILHGGQNPIEPAYFGKPIVFGPYMFNFKGVSDLLLSRQAAIQVKEKKELLYIFKDLLNNSAKRQALGEAAKKVIQENRGATGRNLEILKQFLDKKVESSKPR